MSVNCGRSVVSLDTLISSTNKTDCHDITEILLKVALNTITLTTEMVDMRLTNFVFVFRDLSHDYKLIKDWIQYTTEISSVSMLNLELEHKDRVKLNVMATNGAESTVTAESNGFIVDLTPPELEYIGDGTVANKDIRFQVNI
jgi:hypothetical protein